MLLHACSSVAKASDRTRYVHTSILKEHDSSNMFADFELCSTPANLPMQALHNPSTFGGNCKIILQTIAPA
jgi:hypothetical protein